jgi:hypothetical protein
MKKIRDKKSRATVPLRRRNCITKVKTELFQVLRRLSSGSWLQLCPAGVSDHVAKGLLWADKSYVITSNYFSNVIILMLWQRIFTGKLPPRPSNIGLCYLRGKMHLQEGVK